MISIRFVEEREADAHAFEPVGRREQVALGRHAAEYQMRMSLLRRKELSRGFDGRVRGLHRDLRGRKIAPHEDIQVRNLGEGSGHG